MNKKRLKLKQKYRVILIVLVILISTMFVINQISRIKKEVHECDLNQAYPCTLYDIQNYIRNK